jgi:cobalamin biosynthesis protein CobC
MLVGNDIEATFVGSLDHGGDLTAARRLFPNAPEPFIDLSTGINPFPYPIPALSDDDFARLPDQTSIQRLATIAARWYGAPSGDCVVPAPGTQILLPIVASLAPRGRAAVLGPTFTEHIRAAAVAGHAAVEVSDIARLKQATLAIVVNPNNPDGRIATRTTLLDIADDLRRRGGILVVDEAFGDVAPAGISLAGDGERCNIVVLRSFGKFFGLAGLRLGFALTSPALAWRLDALLGPWSVSGPAIAIAERALMDTAWRDRTLQSLARAAEKLDHLLAGSGLEIVGGTSLFRLTRSSSANELFRRLGRAGILVRRFDEHPAWLVGHSAQRRGMAAA